jgi:hypothetical protein
MFTWYLWWRYDICIDDILYFFVIGLNILEIQANANTFFIAGYDTTANTLSFACYCLATNPDVQTKVFEEINDVLNGVGNMQFSTVSNVM